MIIYEILSTILFILIMPVYYVIRVIKGKYLFGWKEKLGFFKSEDLGDRVIMFHAVSVGETIALENLIKQIKKEFSDYKIVITTGTRTGQDIAKKKFSNIADLITYFPYDIPFCVNKFLKKVKPSVVLIAETEIWPYFAYKCKQNKIHLININARMSDSTFSTYKFMKNFFKYVFANYTYILTQSDEDKAKFISVGADEQITKVMKNLKFDVKKSEEKIEIGQGTSRIIIAGSTHKGENEIVIPVFANLKNKYPDIKLLIAPRHLNRSDEIKELLQQNEIKYGYRSKNDNFNNYDAIILDTIGELGKMYSICNFAFIGGSFNTTGGHNPLEAVVYSKPVVSGPDIHNFKDIYGILTKSEAGKVVKTQRELETYMDKMLSDTEYYNQICKNCDFVFEDNKGALDFVIRQLKEIL